MRYGTSLEQSLKGKVIKSFTTDGKYDITFNTDQGDVNWVTDAGCCSNTWIEHVDLELCVGKEVLSVDHEDLPASWYEANPGPPERDCLRTYGVVIKTTGGTGTIDFRNESNGYYGGSLEVAL